MVPALRVGMQPVTLRVTLHLRRDAERPGRCYHAERGNEQIRTRSAHHPSAHCSTTGCSLRPRPLR
ncbi:hypothetical protein E1K68_26275 [Pseudomonas sp. B2021]|nr:hypothetical protein [Pseudomonas sp. B2021]TKK12823.1 hypothetical protein PflCFBP13510_09005 [Pseudomonas fluorescens]